MFYISPELKHFRSQNQVLIHLGLDRIPSSDTGGGTSKQPKSTGIDSATDGGRPRGAKLQAIVGISGEGSSYVFSLK
jgi:hypothetical protein